MKVSVVIPAYNEEKYIEACLKSLINQTEMPDEIIVVDNNSTDQTVDIVKKFSQIKLLHEHKQGITPTRNKGFNAAQSEIIARTDADTRVPKTWIKKIKKHFQDESIVGIAGPAKFEGMDSMRTRAYWQSEVLFFRSFQRMFHHDALFGPNMAVRKSTWEKIKKEVCTSDKVVHEDVDLAIHLARFGKIHFDPRLIVMSSSRRWKRFSPHFEYPYRYLRTIQHHKQSLHILKEQTQRMKKAFPKTRGIVKKIRSSMHSLYI